MTITAQRQWGSPVRFLMECLSYLLKIVHPDMKATNIQLLKTADKKKIDHMVNVMLTYGIKYVSDMEEWGQLLYRLEP